MPAQKLFLDDTGLVQLLNELGQYLKDKQDKLTFDTVPTINSTNPVQSGGIYQSLSQKQDTLVSGTNIKTMNNNSLLGSGNLAINSDSLRYVGDGTSYVGDGDSLTEVIDQLSKAIDSTIRIQGVGYCTTAATTATKVATLADYSLHVGGMVSVWFQYDVPANATLNINSKGAKQIRLRNSTSTSTQITTGTINAGDTAIFLYDGTYYQLISVNSINDRLKYSVVAVSNSAVSFTSSSKMKPNTVYAAGTVSGTTLTYTPISSLSIGTGALDLDINMSYTAGTASIVGGKLVPIYQIIFRVSSSGMSITLPSTIKWRDGLAPSSEDMAGKFCELTIMNGIATINIVA